MSKSDCPVCKRDKMIVKLEAEVAEWKHRAVGGTCRILSKDEECDCSICQRDRKINKLKGQVNRLSTICTLKVGCIKRLKDELFIANKRIKAFEADNAVDAHDKSILEAEIHCDLCGCVWVTNDIGKWVVHMKDGFETFYLCEECRRKGRRLLSVVTDRLCELSKENKELKYGKE